MDIIFASFLFLIMFLVSCFGCLLLGIIIAGHFSGDIKYSFWQVDPFNGVTIRIWVFITWFIAQIVSTYAFYSAYSKF